MQNPNSQSATHKFNNSAGTKQTAMDLPTEELQSPKTFYFRNLLIIPFYWSLLLHCLCLYPLLSQIDATPKINPSQWTKLLVFHFGFLIFLFAVPFLAAVASLYTSKPVLSFASTIPSSVFKHLFITYLRVFLIRVVYDVLVLGSLVLLLVAVDTHCMALLIFALFVMFLLILADDASFYHLASRVSLSEPVYGFAAMVKCLQLLDDRNEMAVELVFAFLSAFGAINGFFGSHVVAALVWEFNYEVCVGFMAGSYSVGLFVIVIWVRLMVKCVITECCNLQDSHEDDVKSTQVNPMVVILCEKV
ncbi:hypothetical protein Vadar_029433 [Vaccinium darrowii]|uniref:Uncharacterized protein n=1 Tax=Vaccinium darrowii TaxID=229202 RepID=A0ACB7Y9M9_9ERIC|nr:hypothetical protein Vadar_029433 [Vaccinium darrowii]